MLSDHLRRKRCYPADNSGFAMPLTVGLGLVILIIGATMIARSNVDQVSATAQNQTTESLTVAESGMARTLAALNQPENSDLLERSSGNWTALRAGIGGCPDVTPATSPVTLTDTVGTGANAGNYRLVSYSFNPDTSKPGYGTGTLLMQGQSQRSGETKSTSRVEVMLNVRTDRAFPAIYGREAVQLGATAQVVAVDGDSDGQIKRLANVLCTDCQVTTPATECDSQGRPTAAALRAKIGATGTSNIQGRIFIKVGDPNSLGVPEIVANPPSTAIAVNALPESLPRSSHVPDASGVFHYKIDTPAGKITVDTSGGPVYLYVPGSQDLEIEHSGPPEKLVILATAPAPSTQVLTLSNTTALTSFFVYAPQATVRLTGNQPIQGAVWAKKADLTGFGSQLQLPDNLAKQLEPLFTLSAFTGFTYKSDQVGAPITVSGPASSWQRRGI